VTASNRKKTAPKTISAAGITGQRGINAIERIVLESGSRWTPSGPNEIGIDGYIEMFDPATGRPFGLTLAVQSKVVSAIAYWLQGNIPVVLIVSSGDPSHIYWAPVREHFKTWKPGDSTRVTFLKVEHKLDQHTFPRLASIASPRAGLYLPPSRKPETLYTNLLPLELCPPSISIAQSPCRGVHEVWTSLRAEGGDVDGGWDVLLSGLRLERISTSAAYIGNARTVVDEALAYAKERRQFGRPIGDFQAMAHLLADMHTKVEAGRYLMWHAAWAYEHGHDALLEISMAKLFGSEMFAEVANQGMQVLGGYGYTYDFPMQRHFRTARAATITAGTSQMQRNLIAGKLGLHPR